MAFLPKRPAAAAVPLAIAGLLLSGAAFAAAPRGDRADAEAETYRVLRSALQLRDVPLGVHQTCRAAAPLAPARSIGDYLAGFLAHMQAGANSISSTCQAHGGTRRCELWLRHADGEDEWKWGIRFDTDRKGKPDASSVRCLGAG